jgi:adenylylsulfate kinase
MKILIMGLPGSGKSTLAEKLVELVCANTPAEWFNADIVRKTADDWDFSSSGRVRQAERMRRLADLAEEKGIIAVCDFVCPTEELRQIFDADITIWMDTVQTSRYEDTNSMFEPPKEYDFRITEHNDRWPDTLADLIWILE